ncbi:MAG: hypothetical protein U0V73_16340 [Acidimicrobiia bacterium]
MHPAVAVPLFVLGLALVAVILDSAIRTFVLPRGVAVAFTRLVFVAIRWPFLARARRARTYEAGDGVMAMYVPIALLVLPATWVATVALGYTAMFRALGAPGWRASFEASGSALFTLGFVHPGDLPKQVLTFSEAAIGLGLLALLISYLPTIYGAFSRREVPVAELSVLAGSPPSAAQLLIRAHRSGLLGHMDELWRTWGSWFAELGETHTSLASLVFLRSPAPDRSWVTATGCVLDSAALAQSTLDVPWSAHAGLCIRGGFLALRDIADFFAVDHDPDPPPDGPISITRDEFDSLCDELRDNGVPMRADRDQCWKDFAGWRVNYDQTLLALAGVTVAPYAPWSSDRSPRYRRPPIRGRRRPRR